MVFTWSFVRPNDRGSWWQLCFRSIYLGPTSIASIKVGTVEVRTMSLFKTLDEIVGSPYRSRAWKVFDVTLLTVLWTATVVSFVLTYGTSGIASNLWIVPRVLAPVTLIVTARSWYWHPKLSRRARDRMTTQSWTSSGGASADYATPEPIEPK